MIMSIPAVLSSSTRRGFPLLVVPDHENIDSESIDQVLAQGRLIPTHDNRKRSLYCVLLKQPLLQYQFELPPKLHNTHRFCGSSHGWLIASIVDDQDILHVSLFNPFSKNRNNSIIYLPPITENLELLPYKHQDYLFHNHFVSKAILSCDPDLYPGEYVVMVTYGGCRKPAFIRPETDVTWTYLDDTKAISDLIYYKGKIFMIDCCGLIVSCETHQDIISGSWRTRIVSNAQSIIEPELYREKYIVESLDGELMLILRSFDYKYHPPPNSATSNVTGFSIFKLQVKDVDDDSDCDNSSSGDAWVEMKSIGDCALFVGDSESMSIRASNFPGCCSNAIYFTADTLERTFARIDPFGYKDMGIFHLQDGSIESFEYFAPAMSNQTPIWIVNNGNHAS